MFAGSDFTFAIARKAAIVFYAIALSWFGCAAAENPVPADRPVKAGVYADCGISGGGAVEWFRIVQSSPELELTLLDAATIRNGGLDGLDVLVMPGGSSPAIKKELGTNGTERIKDFIRNGGGYVGTCAGCCLMMEEAPDPSRGIGVMPFYRSGSKGRFLMPIAINARGAKALGLKEGRYTVQYSYGPILEPSTQLVENASFEAWGTFRTDYGKYGNKPEMYGRAAVVGGTYGKGRVFAIACHPEFFEDSRAIVIGAFRYVTGREVTLPIRPRGHRALTVAAYAVSPVGVEMAQTLLAIDADSKMDLFPVNDEDIRRGMLDHCDALLFPHGNKEKLEKATQEIVGRFVSRGGFVLGWGGGTPHVPKGGRVCAAAAEALSALREFAADGS